MQITLPTSEYPRIRVEIQSREGNVNHTLLTSTKTIEVEDDATVKAVFLNRKGQPVGQLITLLDKTIGRPPRPKPSRKPAPTVIVPMHHLLRAEECAYVREVEYHRTLEDGTPDYPAPQGSELIACNNVVAQYLVTSLIDGIGEPYEIEGYPCRFVNGKLTRRMKKILAARRKRWPLLAAEDKCCLPRQENRSRWQRFKDWF